PSVDAGTVWPDTVKQGEMIRNVRGLGTLVPEDLQWIPALTSGRVGERKVLAGATVHPDTVILELNNPEMQQQLLDAEAQLKSAEAAYINRKTDLESQLLNQKAGAATVEADFTQA